MDDAHGRALRQKELTDKPEYRKYVREHTKRLKRLLKEADEGLPPGENLFDEHDKEDEDEE